MRSDIKKLPFFLLLVAVVASTHAAQAEDAATEAKWRKYYTEHLPEAKKMIEACAAKGFNKTNGEERIKCDTAETAWQFQPYKRKRATFSSSGGSF